LKNRFEDPGTLHRPIVNLTEVTECRQKAVEKLKYGTIRLFELKSQRTAATAITTSTLNDDHAVVSDGGAVVSFVTIKDKEEKKEEGEEGEEEDEDEDYEDEEEDSKTMLTKLVCVISLYIYIYKCMYSNCVLSPFSQRLLMTIITTITIDANNNNNNIIIIITNSTRTWRRLTF
jgi:predicted histidine transporter YuiF (NhaC family)